LRVLLEIFFYFSKSISNEIVKSEFLSGDSMDFGVTYADNS